jgi:hypothetical protein
MSNRKVNQVPTYDLSVKLSFHDIVNALRQLSPQARKDFIENLQAATSQPYVESVKEARAEYKSDKTFSHKEVFKKRKKKPKKG